MHVTHKTLDVWLLPSSAFDFCMPLTAHVLHSSLSSTKGASLPGKVRCGCIIKLDKDPVARDAQVLFDQSCQFLGCGLVRLGSNIALLVGVGGCMGRESA